MPNRQAWKRKEIEPWRTCKRHGFVTSGRSWWVFSFLKDPQKQIPRRLNSARDDKIERPTAQLAFHYFTGYCWNIFSTAVLTCLISFCLLSLSFSVAMPRHASFFWPASMTSTTSWPL